MYQELQRPMSQFLLLESIVFCVVAIYVSTYKNLEQKNWQFIDISVINVFWMAFLYIRII